MNIHVPQAISNDSPLNDGKILQFKKEVSNATKNFIIPQKNIRREKNKILREMMSALEEFREEFYNYLEQEWKNKSFEDVDISIFYICKRYELWKQEYWSMLHHHMIEWNYWSLEKYVNSIQKCILWKLWIEDDVIEWSNIYDRIFWELELRLKQEATL